MVADSLEPHRVITENDYAILHLPSGARKMIQMRLEGVINMGKFGVFNVEDVLGFPYGQAFEIASENKVIPIEGLEIGITDLTELGDGEVMDGSSNDNRLLDDIADVQKLTAEEIEEMKMKAGGNEVAREIIQNMVKNHASFNKKTSYSQEKYLDRKHKKFLRRFAIHYMTSNEMLEYLYYEKEPFRIMNLSIEMVGLIMSIGNVMPGGNYLVVDETGGLIVYAMLERMGGRGSITLLHENDQPSVHLLTKTRFAKEIATGPDCMVQCINVLQFLEPERPEFTELSQEEIDQLPDVMKKQYGRKLNRHHMLNKCLDRVLGNEFESLIYASTLNPTTFVPRILPRLRGSSPIVIYNHFKEALIELNHIFLREKGILLPNIHHSVVRRYQTIPGKIHPLMTSRADGGFILTGIKVFPIDNVVAVGRGSKRRRLDNGRSETPVEGTSVEGTPAEVTISDSASSDATPVVEANTSAAENVSEST